MENQQIRHKEYPCHAEFITRVSSRAFDAYKSIPHTELMACFEAARWAPSSYNNQPWRYVWSEKGSTSYNDIFETLVDFNKLWCENVPVLIIICCSKTFSHNHKPAQTASLDTGASYMSFVLEAQKRGLITHAMEGFDRAKLRAQFEISDNYTIEALLAVGYPGSKDSLPKELKDKEIPSLRKPLKDIISKDAFIF